MALRGRSGLIIGVLCGVLVGALMLALIQLVWHIAGEHDRIPNRSSLKNQLMRRKSEAMQEILNGMMRGNLRRVETAADQMETYGDTIDGYLANGMYQEHGKEFHQALDDLKNAAGRNDVNAATEAALRLERSCIECHALINPPGN